MHKGLADIREALVFSGPVFSPNSARIRPELQPVYSPFTARAGFSVR